MSARSTLLTMHLTIAAICASGRAHARPDDASSSEAESSERERSRAAFRRGVAELRAEDWSAARASFEEAWSLVQHPSILLNLGIARLRTDDPVLAEQDLVRFLSEDSGAAPEELASAREALAEARTKIGTLRIVTRPATARVLVDGAPVAVRAPATEGEGGVAEVRLRAGAHAVVVEAGGFVQADREVDLPAKGETDLRVTLVANDGGEIPAAPSRSSSGTREIVGWSLAGGAGVALAAGGVMALRALSLSSDYADQASGSFQDEDVKSEGIAYRTGADVALVVALLAGAGAVVLLLTDVGVDSGPGVARVRAPSVRAPSRAPKLGAPALLRW